MKITVAYIEKERPKVRRLKNTRRENREEAAAEEAALSLLKLNILYAVTTLDY